MKKTNPQNVRMSAPSKAMPGTLGSLLLAAAYCAAPHIALGQSAEIRTVVVQGESRSSGQPTVAAGDVVRAIEDPHSGERWFLVRNREHPEGPGRLFLAGTSFEQSHRDSAAGSVPAAKSEGHEAGAVILRAGDQLIVEEHTAIADVSLEAVALEPAKAGATFSVRLKIGGRVERAVARAPGKAAFATATTTTQVLP